MLETKPLNGDRMPRWLVWGVMLICVLPFLLNLLGVDFGSSSRPLDSAPAASIENNQGLDPLFYRLSGAFTHTLLEWSAFCTAIFTVLLAFSHFHIKRDIATPIIGVALFCAGCMDAFHTLAADRLIEAVANNRDLIPFTWAICRLFNALILISGVGIFLLRGERTERTEGTTGIRFVLFISLIFGGIAYAIIRYCATSASLPQTQFPGSIITRPYDLAPLVLFVVAGIFVYLRFYRRAPGLFSHALLISFAPQVVTQLHMVFGSIALFDNGFNIAHFLKIMAYLVPFIGLLMEYIHTYRVQEELAGQLVRVNADLEREIGEHQQASQELSRNEMHLRTVMDNVLDGIIVIDQQGTVDTFNPEAEKIFGYEAVEVIGHNVDMLMPSPYQEEHDAYLARYLETGEARIIGIGREVSGQRKDGSHFPLDLAVSRMDLGGKRMYIGIVRDITERKRFEDELRQAKEAAETASQTKSEFLANMSHEIRTPMNRVVGMVQLLLDTELTPQQQEYATGVSQAADSLLVLLNDILDLSKIEAGKLQIESASFDLQEVAEEVAELMALKAQEKDIDLILRYAVDAPRYVVGDSVRMRQILTNLVSNAVKFTHQGQTFINIEAEEQNAEEAVLRGSRRHVEEVRFAGGCGGRWPAGPPYVGHAL